LHAKNQRDFGPATTKTRRYQSFDTNFTNYREFNFKSPQDWHVWGNGNAARFQTVFFSLSSLNEEKEKSLSVRRSSRFTASSP